jgi:hypothetical protein
MKRESKDRGPQQSRFGLLGCLQPLREQMTHLLHEAHLAIEILRHLVVMAGLEAQRPDAHLPANVLAEADDRLSDLLPAVCLAHINLVEQREFAVKFQAEAEREDKVSDYVLFHQHQVHAAQTGIEQRLSQSRARHLFIEAHLRRCIELSHQPDGSGQIAIGDQLEVGVH